MNEINFRINDIKEIKMSMDVGIKEIYPPIENLEITPTKEEQVFTHENSYGYDEVIVDPIPDEYIIPDGTLPITENATYDVRKFARVSTSVHPTPNLQDKEVTITENGTQNIVADEGYDGLNNVEISVQVEGAIEPPIAQDYISDGLVAWFDGEDDVDASNNWVNRVGTDYISQKTVKVGSAKVNQFKTIKTEKAYRNNMMYGLVSSKDYYIQGYTIEVVGKVNTTATSDNVNTSSGGASLLAFNKTASPMIQIYGSDGMFACLNTYPELNMPKKFTNCVGKRYKYAICLDEIQPRTASSGYFTISYALNNSQWYQKSRENVTNMATNNGNVAIFCYYQSSYFSNAEINCIRIYNRKLTEEELRHNYEIDKARFNLDEYTE